MKILSMKTTIFLGAILSKSASVAAYSMTNNLAKLAGSCCSFSRFEINILSLERSTNIRDFAL